MNLRSKPSSSIPSKCLYCCTFIFGMVGCPWILYSSFHRSIEQLLPIEYSDMSTMDLLNSQKHRIVTSTESIDETYTLRIPDGTFNGGPIFLQSKKISELHSHAHCVGETYQAQRAWQDRSCQFDFLCFNVTSGSYVVFENEADRILSETYAVRKNAHVSSILHRGNESNSVSIGGVNLKWGQFGIPRLKWFPDILEVPSFPEYMRSKNGLRIREPELMYYELAPNSILIPYHSLNGANPGHLIWDDFLPIFTLLSMFNYLDDDQIKYSALPIRQVLQDGERGLWASCDVRDEKTSVCNHMIRKFWPLLAGANSIYNYTTNIDTTFHENKKGSSNLICSKHGVAGLGSLTDHGLNKGHGWEQSDYKSVHNIGRGPQLYQFRNFMLRNMNMDPLEPVERPYRIVFSEKSSDIFIRNVNFERQIALVKQHFPNAKVENYTMKELSLQQQLDVTYRTSIYISLCGGGAVTAMFLPKGASVILYYAEDGGTLNGKMSYKPALLDWDIFNAMSHLRVHWLPRHGLKTKNDEEALVMLIRHELDLIESRTFL
jgi:hypothetical protein